MFRAKVYVQSVRESSQGPNIKANGNKDVIFVPVSASDIPEDVHFSKWTPSGEFKMQVNNPAVLDQIEVGKVFYVDFTEAPSGT